VTLLTQSDERDISRSSGARFTTVANFYNLVTIRFNMLNRPTSANRAELARNEDRIDVSSFASRLPRSQRLIAMHNRLCRYSIQLDALLNKRQCSVAFDTAGISFLNCCCCWLLSNGTTSCSSNCCSWNLTNIGTSH